MPRHPNHKTTNVYWLFDVRPETAAAAGPEGRPFYCGKSVHSVTERLSDHRYTATKFPRRKLSRILTECGEFVRVQIMEIVPVGEDWAARERYWISTLRLLYPGCVNVSNGGDGVPGMIMSDETRAKIRLARIGSKMPEGHGEKIARKTRGQKRTAETCARMSAARTGETRTQEQKDKIRETLTGYKHSPEFRAKMSAINLGRVLSLEHRAAISAGRKGIIFSEEHRAHIGAAHRGRKRSPEAVEKTAAAHRGKSHSPEWCAKISAAQKGRPLSPAHVEALRQGQQRRRERERAAKNVDNSKINDMFTTQVEFKQ